MLWVRPLTAELQKIAEKELNEVSDRIPQDLEHIRAWLLKQPHIKARKDAQWLIIFLRSSKFSLERTKEKLDRFYTVRTLIPEVFSNRDPFEENIQEILNTRFIVALPYTFQYTQPKTLLVTIGNLNSNIHALYDIWKVGTMITDMYSIEEDTLSVNGVQAVVDLKNCDLNYARQVTPTYMKNIGMLLQKTYPLRIKKIIFLNSNSWFITFWNTFKLLISNKLKERIIFCDAHLSNSPSKYSFANMMEEFCRNETTWDELAIELKCKLENFRGWFLEDLQYGIDESKRPERAKPLGNIYGGVQGAFRNLDID